MDRIEINRETTVEPNKTRSSISVHRNLFWPWIKQPHDDTKRNGHRKRDRYYKYIPAIIATLIASPVNAETIGGVSATASPVANSSGSVTNQAIQVLQGPYITNTYGSGIQCQGATLNMTPYVTGNVSAQKPYEPYFNDPVYDISDNFGALDDDGNDIGDGIIDNPGRILFRKSTRTGQKDNYNLSLGFSATWSRPLDKKLQEQCKEAAQASIDMMTQLTANKRLDFEIGRLKNCGELMKAGISFAPGTRYAAICSDVIVQNINLISPHRHSIPSSSSSGTQNEERESPHSSDAAHLGGPLQTKLGDSYPVRSQSSSPLSSSQVSPLLTKDQQKVLRAVQRSSQQVQ